MRNITIDDILKRIREKLEGYDVEFEPAANQWARVASLQSAFSQDVRTFNVRVRRGKQSVLSAPMMIGVDEYGHVGATLGSWTFSNVVHPPIGGSPAIQTNYSVLGDVLRQAVEYASQGSPTLTAINRAATEHPASAFAEPTALNPLAPLYRGAMYVPSPDLNVGWQEFPQFLPTDMQGRMVLLHNEDVAAVSHTTLSQSGGGVAALDMQFLGLVPGIEVNAAEGTVSGLSDPRKASKRAKALAGTELTSIAAGDFDIFHPTLGALGLPTQAIGERATMIIAGYSGKLAPGEGLLASEHQLYAEYERHKIIKLPRGFTENEILQQQLTLATPSRTGELGKVTVARIGNEPITVRVGGPDTLGWVKNVELNKEAGYLDVTLGIRQLNLTSKGGGIKALLMQTTPEALGAAYQTPEGKRLTDWLAERGLPTENILFAPMENVKLGTSTILNALNAAPMETVQKVLSGFSAATGIELPELTPENAPMVRQALTEHITDLVGYLRQNYGVKLRETYRPIPTLLEKMRQNPEKYGVVSIHGDRVTREIEAIALPGMTQLSYTYAGLKNPTFNMADIALLGKVMPEMATQIIRSPENIERFQRYFALSAVAAGTQVNPDLVTPLSRETIIDAIAKTRESLGIGSAVYDVVKGAPGAFVRNLADITRIKTPFVQINGEILPSPSLMAGMVDSPFTENAVISRYARLLHMIPGAKPGNIDVGLQKANFIASLTEYLTGPQVSRTLGEYVVPNAVGTVGMSLAGMPEGSVFIPKEMRERLGMTPEEYDLAQEDRTMFTIRFPWSNYPAEAGATARLLSDREMLQVIAEQFTEGDYDAAREMLKRINSGGAMFLSQDIALKQFSDFDADQYYAAKMVSRLKLLKGEGGVISGVVETTPMESLDFFQRLAKSYGGAIIGSELENTLKEMQGYSLDVLQEKVAAERTAQPIEEMKAGFEATARSKFDAMKKAHSMQMAMYVGAMNVLGLDPVNSEYARLALGGMSVYQAAIDIEKMPREAMDFANLVWGFPDLERHRLYVHRQGYVEYPSLVPMISGTLGGLVNSGVLNPQEAAALVSTEQEQAESLARKIEGNREQASRILTEHLKQIGADKLFQSTVMGRIWNAQSEKGQFLMRLAASSPAGLRKQIGEVMRLYGIQPGTEAFLASVNQDEALKQAMDPMLDMAEQFGFTVGGMPLNRLPVPQNVELPSSMLAHIISGYLPGRKGELIGTRERVLARVFGAHLPSDVPLEIQMKAAKAEEFVAKHGVEGVREAILLQQQSLRGIPYTVGGPGGTVRVTARPDILGITEEGGLANISVKYRTEGTSSEGAMEYARAQLASENIALRNLYHTSTRDEVVSYLQEKMGLGKEQAEKLYGAMRTTFEGTGNIASYVAEVSIGESGQMSAHITPVETVDYERQIVSGAPQAIRSFVEESAGMPYHAIKNLQQYYEARSQQPEGLLPSVFERAQQLSRMAAQASRRAELQATFKPVSQDTLAQVQQLAAPPMVMPAGGGSQIPPEEPPTATAPPAAESGGANAGGANASGANAGGSGAGGNNYGYPPSMPQLSPEEAFRVLSESDAAAYAARLKAAKEVLFESLSGRYVPSSADITALQRTFTGAKRMFALGKTVAFASAQELKAALAAHTDAEGPLGALAGKWIGAHGEAAGRLGAFLESGRLTQLNPLFADIEEAAGEGGVEGFLKSLAANPGTEGIAANIANLYMVRQKLSQSGFGAVGGIGTLSTYAQTMDMLRAGSPGRGVQITDADVARIKRVTEQFRELSGSLETFKKRIEEVSGSGEPLSREDVAKGLELSSQVGRLGKALSKYAGEFTGQAFDAAGRPTAEYQAWQQAQNTLAELQALGPLQSKGEFQSWFANDIERYGSKEAARANLVEDLSMGWTFFKGRLISEYTAGMLGRWARGSEAYERGTLGLGAALGYTGAPSAAMYARLYRGSQHEAFMLGLGESAAATTAFFGGIGGYQTGKALGTVATPVMLGGFGYLMTELASSVAKPFAMVAGATESEGAAIAAGIGGAAPVIGIGLAGLGFTSLLFHRAQEQWIKGRDMGWWGLEALRRDLNVRNFTPTNLFQTLLHVPSTMHHMAQEWQQYQGSALQQLTQLGDLMKQGEWGTYMTALGPAERQALAQAYAVNTGMTLSGLVSGLQGGDQGLKTQLERYAQLSVALGVKPEQLVQWQANFAQSLGYAPGSPTAWNMAQQLLYTPEGNLRPQSEISRIMTASSLVSRYGISTFAISPEQQVGEDLRVAQQLLTQPLPVVQRNLQMRYGLDLLGTGLPMETRAGIEQQIAAIAGFGAVGEQRRLAMLQSYNQIAAAMTPEYGEIALAQMSGQNIAPSQVGFYGQLYTGLSGPGVDLGFMPGSQEAMAANQYFAGMRPAEISAMSQRVRPLAGMEMYVGGAANLARIAFGIATRFPSNAVLRKEAMEIATGTTTWGYSMGVGASTPVTDWLGRQYGMYESWTDLSGQEHAPMFELQQAYTRAQWAQRSWQFGYQIRGVEASYQHALRGLGFSEQTLNENLAYAGQQFAFGMAELGLARQRAAISRAMFGENWAYSEQMRSLAWQQQQLGFGMTEYNWDYTQRTRAMTRGWALEDLGISKSRAATQFQWQEEDIDRAIRYASGLQKAQLIRQRERLEEQYGWQQSDFTRKEDRLREQWRLEDERFEKVKQYQQELIEIAKKRHELEMDHAKKMYKENKKLFKLQDESLKLQEKRLVAAYAHQQRLAKIQHDRIEDEKKWLKHQRDYQLERINKSKEFWEKVELPYLKARMDYESTMKDHTEKYLEWIRTAKQDKDAAMDVINGLIRLIHEMGTAKPPAPPGPPPDDGSDGGAGPDHHHQPGQYGPGHAHITVQLESHDLGSYIVSSQDDAALHGWIPR